MEKKYFLSFQTVFRLNENVRFLEEFLIYYIHIGFDHFYLYNNDGSITDFSKESHNKHGDVVRNDEPIEDKLMFDDIMKKYGDKITYTKWQPLDENNNIVYGQDYATMDFIKRYAHETEWVAIMDLDEFLYSEKNLDIPAYFRNLSDDVSCIFLGQKPFIHRFQAKTKYITQDFRSADYVYPGGGGSKNIVRTNDFVDLETIRSLDLENFEMSRILKCPELKEIDTTWHLHVHNIIVKNKKITPSPEELRFNHYQHRISNDSPESTFKMDDCMTRYTHLFSEGFSSQNQYKNENKPMNSSSSLFFTVFILLFLLFFIFQYKKIKQIKYIYFSIVFILLFFYLSCNGK